MHEDLEQLINRQRDKHLPVGSRSLRLQVARRAARWSNWVAIASVMRSTWRHALLDHAGDNETLVTAEVIKGVGPSMQRKFRNLDWMHLRGRAEPVHVHVMGGRRGSDTMAPATQFGAVSPTLGLRPFD